MLKVWALHGMEQSKSGFRPSKLHTTRRRFQTRSGAQIQTVFYIRNQFSDFIFYRIFHVARQFCAPRKIKTQNKLVRKILGHKLPIFPKIYPTFLFKLPHAFFVTVPLEFDWIRFSAIAIICSTVHCVFYLGESGHWLVALFKQDPSLTQQQTAPRLRELNFFLLFNVET